MIKKIIAPLLLFGGVALSQAQVSTVEFALEKDQKVVNNLTTGAGYSSIVVLNKETKEGNLDIYTYNNDLELSYQKKINSKFDDNSSFFGGGSRRPIEFYDMFSTEKGEFMYADVDEVLLDKNGGATDYFYTVDKFYLGKSTDKSSSYKRSIGEVYGDLLVKSQFANKDYRCWIGPKVDEKRKPVNENKYYLIRRSNNGQAEEKLPLEVYTGQEGFENLKVVTYNDNVFYTVSKELNEEKTKNTYYITGFDYDGNEVLKTTIPVALDGKFFVKSDNGGGVVAMNTYLYTGTSIYSKTPTQQTGYQLAVSFEGTGNVYVDEANQVFYIYGLYADHVYKNRYKVDYEGFYVQKYSFSGELIWKQQKAILDKKGFNETTTYAWMNVDFYRIKDELIMSICEGYSGEFAHFFVMDSDKGNIKENEKINFDTDKVLFRGYKKGIKKDNALVAGLYVKDDFGKSFLDINTLFASYLNGDVKNYLVSKKDGELSYNATITEEGVYLIEENLDDKVYKLMKFEWL